ncbi:hypothetical protein [Actinomyces ruminicola]|nr:hypothetical protein [Actinomyces ruminicola]
MRPALARTALESPAVGGGRHARGATGRPFSSTFLHPGWGA